MRHRAGVASRQRVGHQRDATRHALELAGLSRCRARNRAGSSTSDDGTRWCGPRNTCNDFISDPIESQSAMPDSRSISRSSERQQVQHGDTDAASDHQQVGRSEGRPSPSTPTRGSATASRKTDLRRERPSAVPDLSVVIDLRQRLKRVQRRLPFGHGALGDRRIECRHDGTERLPRLSSPQQLIHPDRILRRPLAVTVPRGIDRRGVQAVRGHQMRPRGQPSPAPSCADRPDAP